MDLVRRRGHWFRVGLGAMWGSVTARRYLQDAGFRSIEVHRLAHDIMTISPFTSTSSHIIDEPCGYRRIRRARMRLVA
jgi:hypothetical protein